ncbi:MAG: NAD-dependent epimerase/dehydratase family protein [Deltaproteobacteria bacterium]|nr:NAD-dependent epimerase/dehydratase family protein [Deltaproteobacteria bacterium]
MNINRKSVFKRIMVTGGSAVAGTAMRSVAKAYPGSEFIFSDCDLIDRDSTFEYVNGCGPDAIIHLAAISGGIGLSTRYPATLLRDNVLINFNVLEAARRFNIKKTVMTLSSGMYPPDAPIPIKEESVHCGNPHESNYSYAFAKRLVEPSIKAYRTQYGLNIIGLVPNGIFGENDNFNLEEASMLPSLIRRFYEKRHEGSKLVVWGDGSPLREYTYSIDIARAFMWCLENYDGAQILNIGSTEEHSVKEIALMTAGVLRISKERVFFDISKPNGVFRKSTDNTRFLKLSGFEYTPFREGLENTVRWFQSTYENSPETLRTRSKIRSDRRGVSRR